MTKKPGGMKPSKSSKRRAMKDYVPPLSSGSVIVGFAVQMTRVRYPSELSRHHNLRKNEEMRKLQRSLRAEGASCERCTVATASELHHKVPLAQGGAPFDLDNIEKLCAGCHAAVHRASVAQLTQET